MPPNCKLCRLASIISSNSHRISIHSLVPVRCFLPHGHYNNRWSLSRPKAPPEISRRCNACKSFPGCCINLDSKRMYIQHEIMEQEGFLSHGGCHDPALPFGVICRLLAHIPCCKKTSGTDSLPSISKWAWKTSQDNITVEKVDLEYVLCLLYFLFVLHAACFFHGCLVRYGKMVVTHCWWFYLDGCFSKFHYQPFIVLLASSWNTLCSETCF